mgnify:CR=1 FL=1|jgi:hypothetical protein
MATTFTAPPVWTNTGTAPSETLKTNGFQAGYKPPAPIFNYMFNKYGICLTELQTEVNKKSEVGKSLAGQTTSPTNGTSVVAGEGAEIFNDYSERTFDINTEMVITGNVASGDYSHAEGRGTTASGNHSHAEGYFATASGNYSHAEGCRTTASGNYSHAEGCRTTASGECSHAEGFSTTASPFQFVTGKFNIDKAGCSRIDDQSNNSSIFIVGYGTNNTKANAFRITASGKCMGTSSFGSSGADYAEYFEWQDGNKNSEDRRGLFVTLDGDKIRLANANDDYILGVISANPSVVGDVQSENWHGMYKKDVFGQPLTETVEVPENTDDKTGEVISAHTITRLVVNPDYNPDEEYTSREFRKEWACVGLMGKLIIVDDGTCVVNGYCKVADGGKATKADTGYRVMKRLDDTHIQILYR